MFQENKSHRSPLQIIGLIVIFILAVLIVLTFVIFGMFKDEGSAPKLFGYRVCVVQNDRMEPRIPEGSAVFVEEGTLPDPSKQSVILCRIDDQLWVIGFVGTQTTETGETSYLVKYDNASDDKTWGIKESDIIGVATTQDPVIGKIISFASSKAGMMIIVIIPCAILIAYEVIMLLAGRGGYSRGSREDDRKSKKHTPAENTKDSKEHSHSHSAEHADEDEIPERENIVLPVDTAKEERFVEKQLRKGVAKLSDAVKEETDTIRSDEIKLESLKLEPEPEVRRTDILREGAQSMGALKSEAEKIAENLKSFPVPEFDENELPKKPSAPKKDFEVEAATMLFDGLKDKSPAEKDAPAPVTPAPKAPEKTEAKPVDDSPLKDLSPARIDELIKLLEEEKKRLGGN